MPHRLAPLLSRLEDVAQTLFALALAVPACVWMLLEERRRAAEERPSGGAASPRRDRAAHG